MTGMIEHFLQEELTKLKANHLYRRVRTLKPLSPTRAEVDGREIILFCGNDYLGLSHHPQVIAAAKAACDRYGAGSGAARLISGTWELHTQLEEKIARFKGKERAVLFSAGYLANLGTLSALVGVGDVVIMDKLCHASLIDGARLSGATLRTFPHKNYPKCEAILQQSGGARRKMIVSDTVFSMEGDLADLGELVRLKEKYDGVLLVDDAHGTGVVGPGGRGAACGEGLEGKIDLVTGTLSKALGTLGGFAAGSETLIQYLINFSRPFIFATSLAPAVCAAALEGLRRIEEEPVLRTKLWRNVERVYQGLAELGFDLPRPVSPIFQILLGEEKRALQASEALWEKGILIPAIRYPTVPKGKARLRLTVSASHEEEEIQHLVTSLRIIKKDVSSEELVHNRRRLRDSL